MTDPEKRLGVEDALKHPWISERDQTDRRYITPLAVLAKDPKAPLSVSVEIVEALFSFAKMSRFRRLCFSLMAWSLTQEERCEVRDAFIELDVERQGVIKLSSLKQVMKERLNLSVNKSDSLAQRMEHSTVEGELRYADFLAAMAAKTIALHEEHFRSTFRRFDKSKRGGIDTADLTNVIGAFFSREEIHYIIHALDTEGTGLISYENFFAYLTKQGQEAPKDSQASAKPARKSVNIDKKVNIDDGADPEPEDDWELKATDPGCSSQTPSGRQISLGAISVVLSEEDREAAMKCAMAEEAAEEEAERRKAKKCCTVL